jgi:integrase
MIRRKAGIAGCWHEHRHTLTTELAESGGCDKMVMAIAGHLSRRMLERFSHVWMQA